MPVILFVLGTIVGSFLNVVGTRWGLPDRKPSIRNFSGRSKCPHCGQTLKWFELVPIFSFLIQKAHCRSCGAKISYQYLIIEILTGLVFATVPLWMLPVFCIYIVITIYDFKYKIIPDELVYTAIILSLIYALINFRTYELLDLLSGPIIFLFFASIWLLSRGRAMGFGDAKLGASVGILLGAAQGFSAIVLAFWIGAVFSLLYIFLKSDKGLTMKSEVPFAPFIIIGAWVSMAFHINIFHVATL